jgi:uncharacterized membrane protein
MNIKRAICVFSVSLFLITATSGSAHTTVVSSDSTHATARPMSQPITREQVTAELHEAYRNGLLHANPNPYPSEYIEHAQRQLRMSASEDGKVYEKALLE